MCEIQFSQHILAALCSGISPRPRCFASLSVCGQCIPTPTEVNVRCAPGSAGRCFLLCPPMETRGLALGVWFKCLAFGSKVFGSNAIFVLSFGKFLACRWIDSQKRHPTWMSPGMCLLRGFAMLSATCSKSLADRIMQNLRQQALVIPSVCVVIVASWKPHVLCDQATFAQLTELVDLLNTSCSGHDGDNLAGGWQ